MGKYSVLMFNPYYCDLIVTGLPELPRLGLDLFGSQISLGVGGAFNTVRALHRLGETVGWACDFGSDLFSQFALAEIRKEGVDTSLLRIHDCPVRRFSLAFSYCHDRGFISYRDPSLPFDRQAAVREHRPLALILGSLEYGPGTLALVEAAHATGARVLMDCQSTGVDLGAHGLAETLRAVDVFLPNAAEAMQLTGASTPERAAEVLAEIAPLVVIKLGAEGAAAYGSQGPVHLPALPVQVVDTTGAGDCFNAGFLYGYLRSWPLERCLRAGNICGSLSTTGHGTEVAPFLVDLMARL